MARAGMLKMEARERAFLIRHLCTERWKIQASKGHSAGAPPSNISCRQLWVRSLHLRLLLPQAAGLRGAERPLVRREC